MSLPELLRRLRTTASQRDRRGVLEALDILSRAGYSSDVAAFVSRLPAQDAATISEFTRPAPSDSEYAQKFNAFSQSSGGGGYRPGSGASMAGVTRDAASLIYCPATAAEWASTSAVAGISSPFGLYGLQEAAGNLADSIGTATLTSSSMNYQQAVAGWTRKAVAILDSGGAHASNVADAGLPDMGTTSMCALLYVAVTAVTAQRYVLWLGDTGSFAWGVGGRIDTGPLWGILDANVGTATGTVDHGTGVIPVLLKYDVTNSVCQLYTNQEKMTASPFTLATAGKRGIGIGIATDPTAYCLYMATWKSSGAEMSDGSVRSLLQTLNWTVAW